MVPIRSRSAADRDGGGGLFQHFLVAALERAVALTQMDGGALAVAEHLELDMAGIAQVFFKVDGRVPERRLGLRARLGDQGGEVVRIFDHLHAAPTAARRRLDDHRIADLVRDRRRLVRIAHRAGRSGDERQAQSARLALRGNLVAHDPDVFGFGADELQPVLLHDLREARVLRQKAVARVDRVGLADLGRRDDVGDIQIAVGGRRRADADRLVRQAHVHGVGVGGRVDRDRADAHFVRGPVDAQRDFAPVGDQQLLDGHQSMMTSGWSYSTG